MEEIKVGDRVNYPTGRGGKYRAAGRVLNIVDTGKEVATSDGGKKFRRVAQIETAKGKHIYRSVSILEKVAS